MDPNLIFFILFSHPNPCGSISCYYWAKSFCSRSSINSSRRLPAFTILSAQFLHRNVMSPFGKINKLPNGTMDVSNRFLHPLHQYFRDFRGLIKAWSFLSIIVRSRIVLSVCFVCGHRSIMIELLLRPSDLGSTAHHYPLLVLTSQG